MRSCVCSTVRGVDSNWFAYDVCMLEGVASDFYDISLTFWQHASLNKDSLKIANAHARTIIC